MTAAVEAEAVAYELQGAFWPLRLYAQYDEGHPPRGSLLDVLLPPDPEAFRQVMFGALVPFAEPAAHVLAAMPQAALRDWALVLRLSLPEGWDTESRMVAGLEVLFSDSGPGRRVLTGLAAVVRLPWWRRLDVFGYALALQAAREEAESKKARPAAPALPAPLEETNV